MRSCAIKQSKNYVPIFLVIMKTPYVIQGVYRIKPLTPTKGVYSTKPLIITMEMKITISMNKDIRRELPAANLQKKQLNQQRPSRSTQNA